jgi:HSP20 family protein
MALIRRGPQALSQRDPFGGWLFDWPEFFRGFEPFWPLVAGQLQVEEFIEDGTLVIRVELAGIDPGKDLELTVREGALHLHAERRQDKTVEAKGEYRSELRYGAFSRVLPMPVGASEQDITASYSAGILEIRVPFDQHKAEVTRIPVTAT